MPQQGLATLWACTLLILLTGLWGWLGLQAVNAESTRGSQQMHAAQALANAEANLETAVAHLAQVYGSQAIAADLHIWSSASADICPADKSPPQWQCARWAPDHLLRPEWTDSEKIFVRLVRDVRNAPHRIQVSVDATLNNLQPGAGSRATVQQSLYVPISTSLRNNTDAGQLTSLVLNEQALTEAKPHCNTQAWQTVFGQLSPQQLEHLSYLQSRNGLSSTTLPTRTVYWIDSPEVWTQSLGTLTSPVVLVFSEAACALRCPSLASHTQVVGTVFFQNQCKEHNMQNWQAGSILGRLGIESQIDSELSMSLLNSISGLSGLSTLQYFANSQGAFNFEWPVNINASVVQRVAGTWKNAGY